VGRQRRKKNSRGKEPNVRAQYGEKKKKKGKRCAVPGGFVHARGQGKKKKKKIKKKDNK